MDTILKRFHQTVMVDGHNQYKTAWLSLVFGTANIGMGLAVKFLLPWLFTSMPEWLGYVFLFSGILMVFSAWLAWQGKVRLSFNIFLTCWILQLLVLNLAFIGFGFVTGIALVTSITIFVMETFESKKGNILVFLAYTAGLIFFTVDGIWLRDRMTPSDPMRRASLFLILAMFMLLALLFIRNYWQLNLTMKFIFPTTALINLSAFGFLLIGLKLVTGSPSGLPDSIVLFDMLPIPDILAAQFGHVNAMKLTVVPWIYLTSCIFILYSKFIIYPIIQLAESSEKVQDGNLNVHVSVENQDEIGIITNVYNLLVFRLRQIISTLEMRVSERTSSLASVNEKLDRGIQTLVAVTEIAEQIAQVQDLEIFFQIVVDEISKKPGFGHANLYLFDEKKEYFSLRAGSSELGKRLAVRGQRTRINQQDEILSAVLYGEVKVVTYSEDEIGNSMIGELPETREVVFLPFGDKGLTIGFLSIQSREVGAFPEEQIRNYSLLAKMIAGVYTNLKRYNEVSYRLDEIYMLRQDSVMKDWQNYLLAKKNRGLDYSYGSFRNVQTEKIDGSNLDWRKLIDDGILIGLPPNPSDPNVDTVPSNKFWEMERGTSVTIPISLRGQLIGAIKLQDDDSARNWTSEEIKFIRAVSDQVGLALENARLIEETQQRAEREATVTKIAGKLRASNDPEAIIQTAVDELRKVLKINATQVVFTGLSNAPDQNELSENAHDNTPQNPNGGN